MPKWFSRLPLGLQIVGSLICNLLSLVVLAWIVQFIIWGLQWGVHHQGIFAALIFIAIASLAAWVNVSTRRRDRRHLERVRQGLAKQRYR